MMNSIFDLQSYFLNPYALPHFLVGVLITLEGIFVFTQSKKSIIPIAYLITTATAGTWLTGVGLICSSSHEAAATFWSRYYSWFGIIFITPAVYLFSTTWNKALLKKKKKMIYVNYFCALVFYIICISTNTIVDGQWPYRTGFFPKAGILEFPFIIWFYTLMVLSFGNFLRNYRKEKTEIRKKNAKLMIVAFSIAFFGSVEYLPNYGIHVFPVAFLPMFLFTSIMGYCVVRYKLMDIETVIHKTLGWFLTSVAMIAPLAFLLYATRAWYASLNTFGAWIYLSAVLLGFLLFTKNFQPKIDHFFLRRHANLQRVLDRFSQELVHLKNLEDLLDHFVQTLRESVYVKQVSVYLRDEASQQMIPARMTEMRDLKPIAVTDPFLEFLENNDSVVIADLAENDPEFEALRDAIQQYFKETQAMVAVPLILGEKLIGVVHLGKKENLKKYRAEEIHFFTQMRASVTIAISNSKQFENVSRLYQQVQVQNDRLKELDRLKSEFLANISHELRTPLNGILGLVESILDGADGPVNDPQRRHLRMIIESGINLKELINNLLELSKMESGRETIEVREFNVLNVVDAVLVLLDNLAVKKNLKLLRIAPQQVDDVFGDPVKIQRVLTNLVGNAIKFTEKGSVTLRVVDAADCVRVEVEDTGIGLTPDQQQIIFDRFRQADGSSTRRFEGTGLGLSIAREIMRLHGGDITVQSEFGKGSTFSFALSKMPFEVAALGDPGAVSDQRIPAETGLLIESQGGKTVFGGDPEYDLAKDDEFLKAIQGSGEKILIIDDNAVNREVVRTRLELNHYQVIEAADGVEGFEKLEKEKPDLVILDLMMPRMSGYEFCKGLRSDFSPDELPVIMLTAKTEMGDKIYGLHLGANDYISKPFNKEELIARVGVLLKIRQMNRELRKWNEDLEKRVDDRTRELVKTQEQLIQAEKLATIGTLAGGIAHEINNPLTAVLTNAQILKMAANADDLDSLSLIEEGAKRCQMIVQKLMKYARKSPEMDTFHPTDVNAVVLNAVNFLKYQLKQENIELLATFDAVDPVVSGNANELEQVLTNLILNAKDAVKQAEKNGFIKIKTLDSGNSVRIIIEDNGVGIPKENIKKIFDPFFTTKDVGKGTGLGLAVSLGIIQKHKGRIEVESEPGKGATFAVILPKIRVDTSESRTKGKAASFRNTTGG